jgi:metal iron transporter
MTAPSDSILGATVMPHALYLSSKMATMRRLAPEDYEDDDKEPDDKADPDDRVEEHRQARERSLSASQGPQIRLHLPQPMSFPASYSPRETDENKQIKAPKPTLACVKAHLSHSVWGPSASATCRNSSLIQSASQQT